jgi:CubicO group peptidase (beta-lactamase class C family)
MTVLSAQIDGWIENQNFSGVVYISHISRAERAEPPLYARAHGSSDRAHAIANTVETLFAIASGTKLLTALAVLSLVDAGEVTLDTPVTRVLEGAAELLHPGTTLRQLLAHTSGMGDYLDESTIADIEDYLLDIPVHRLERPGDYWALLRGRAPKLAPGAAFAYNNSGYVLLALVAEALTGQSYYDVVQRRVCEPAGLVDTTFPRLDDLPGRAAIGYLPGRGFRCNAFHLPMRGGGDGGAYSTARDVARLWAALFSGRIVAPPLLAEMRRPQHPAGARAYGLGLWLAESHVFIEGSDAGVSFRSRFDPTTGIAYSVLSNTTRGAWPIARALDACFPQLSTLAARDGRC